MTGAWARGAEIAGAAALAVKRVNEQTDLLNGYALAYSWDDSGCSQKKGLEAIGRIEKALGDTNQKIHAVIGPGCSDACEVTSHLLVGKEIPQISWGMSPPYHSNPRAHVHTHAHACACMCTRMCTRARVYTPHLTASYKVSPSVCCAA